MGKNELSERTITWTSMADNREKLVMSPCATADDLYRAAFTCLWNAAFIQGKKDRKAGISRYDGPYREDDVFNWREPVVMESATRYAAWLQGWDFIDRPSDTGRGEAERPI